MEGGILAPKTCAPPSYTHGYVTRQKGFEDRIKVSYQLTLNNYPGGQRHHTSPDKQRSLLLVEGVKSETPSMRPIPCACWLEDEGGHMLTKWGPQSYNQKELDLPQCSL